MGNENRHELSEEEARLFDAFRELDDDALLVKLGRAAWQESAPVIDAAPPSRKESEERGHNFLNSNRERICGLIAKSGLVVKTLQPNELIDSADKAAALIVCFKSAFQPVLAVVLALLVIRHGLRWLCPDLIACEGDEPES